MTIDILIGPLIGAAVVIGTGLIVHAVHDAYKQGRMEAEIKSIKEAIGSHETGIRGELHRQVGLISRLRAIVFFIGKKLNLDVMKDLDGDK